jgi:MFS family permease
MSDPYASLRYPEFVSYITISFLLTTALLIQEVVLGYEIYKITHDPLSLGIIGLAEAFPYISLVLFGGHFADNLERKGILMVSLGIIITASASIVWLMLPGAHSLPQASVLLVIYGVIAVIGFAKGFFNPAANSLKAFLVPKELYGNSSTWSSSFWQAGAIVGPGCAGFLYAKLGLIYTLVIVVALLVICMLLIFTISRKPVQVTDKATISIFESLKEGIKYVFRTKIILYSISLDLFSVLFGGVVALLPVFAEDILKVGAEGLGVLRAAPSVGALLMMVVLIYNPPLQQAWRNLLIAVAGFGIATLVFALSRDFTVSIIALFLTGAFDSISVVIRQTILQVLTPDEMRGRVASVNSIFVSSSNELGAFESGLAAKLLGTVPSVVFGGVMTMVVVTWVWLTSKDLFKVKVTP